MKLLDLLTRPRTFVGLGLAVGLALAPGVVLAQDPAGDDITRDLNSGPPVAIANPTEAEAEAEAEAVVESEVQPEETAKPAEAPVLEPAALTVAERRALPFRVDLPEGAGLYPGRSGPEFDIFSVRRDGRGLLMIYVGPQSQFPIYSGEQRERAGRRSVIVTESGRALALEHLYRLPDRTELHVWVSAVSDEDRALADAIGQTVEPR